MLRLTHARIEGITGGRTFDAPFSSGVNFLIGRNGVGKTTVINLLRLAISGDVQNLRKSQFEQLLLSFEGKHQTATLRIKRYLAGDQPTLAITFEPSGSPPIEGSFSGSELAGLFVDASPYGAALDGPIMELRRMVQSTWVSVNRFEREPTKNALLSYAATPDAGKTAIDARLDDIRGRLQTYMWDKWSQSYWLSQAFMKRTIASLLDPPNVERATAADSRLEGFREQMLEMFSDIVGPESNIDQRLEGHLSRISSSAEQPISQLDAEGVLTRGNHLRLIDMLAEFEELRAQRSEIDKPSSTLQALLDVRFHRKRFDFDGQQKARFLLERPQQDSVDLEALSSGEKQFFVFLAETVLQGGKPCIFLADEPEISLHLEWQNTLVRDILAINPNTQIVFATHSPEILGPYGECTIDLEKRIS